MTNSFYISPLLLFVITIDILAISTVYNLKLRHVFDLPSEIIEKYHWAVTCLPIAFRRTRQLCQPDITTSIREKKILSGSLFNVRYTLNKYWWFDFTTALENEQAKTRGGLHFTRSRTGFDDIVLSVGRVFHPTQKTNFALFGLAGFPTKTSVSVAETLDTLVGTRFFGIGGGAEFSYQFFNTKEEGCTGIIQNQVVHFFERNWQPILPPGGRNHPGEIIDILAGISYRQRKTIIDIGFDETFFVNQFLILPDGTKVAAGNFTRQSFYFFINHIFPKFFCLDKPLVLGAGTLFSWSHRDRTRIYIGLLNVTFIF